MNVVQWVVVLLPSAPAAVAIWLVVRFERGLDAYTSEKAKNLATSQDIAAITRKVAESILRCAEWDVSYCPAHQE